MRSPESLPSARFDLAPSPALAWLLVAGHLAAGAALHAAVGGLAGAALAVASAALGAASAWSRALHRAARSIRSFELLEDRVAGERARVVLRGGAATEAPVAPRRYVTRWLVTVTLRAPVRRTILISCDMLGPEAFRRLRVWALWGRLPPSSGAGQPVPGAIRTPSA